MHFENGELYHFYNRGNNRKTIFFNDENYLFFLKKIKNEISPRCEILAWCLMPNHFHFLIMANENTVVERKTFGGMPMQELPYRIGVLLSTYSRAINKQNGSTGSLFQQKTKAKSITELSKGVGHNFSFDTYLITVMHYIHQNPLRAGLVSKLEDWKYSSFRDYSGLRNGSLCNKDLLMSLTGYDLNRFYEDSYNLADTNICGKF